MTNYYVPSNGVNSWRQLLANPEKQWREGYSAYELAHSWEGQEFPLCVRRIFEQGNIPLFQQIKPLYGFPEYKVALPGGATSSQNDLYVIAKANNELISIMVEGKVSETFGETVQAWLGDNASEGKHKRLSYLLDKLKLEKESVLDKRYQLLHRTASALIEAEHVTAKNALMLIHSFSETGKWFNDFAEFVELFHLSPKKDMIIGPVIVNGFNLYFGWVTGEKVANDQ